MIVSEEVESSGSSSNLTHRRCRPAGGGSSATFGASGVGEGGSSGASGAARPTKGKRRYLGNRL